MSSRHYAGTTGQRMSNESYLSDGGAHDLQFLWDAIWGSKSVVVTKRFNTRPNFGIQWAHRNATVWRAPQKRPG